MIAMKKIGQACLESEKFWKRQPEHGEIKRFLHSVESENGTIMALFDKEF